MPMGIGPGLSVTRFESGIPGWMTGMDLGWDFTQNVQYSGATNPTDTHSATIYAQSAAGVWSPFAANTLVRTDLGLQTVPTRTNSIRNSTASNGAVLGVIGSGGAIGTNWTLSGTSSSFTITVTDVDTDPSTGLASIAIRFVSASAPTTLVIRSEISTGAAITPSAAWTASIFAALAGGSTANFNGAYVQLETFGGAGASNGTLTALTAATTRLSVTNASTPAAATFGRTNLVFTFTAGTAVDFTVRVAQAQLELGAFASAPILTTSGTATVNGNQQVVDLTGRLSAGVGGIVQINVLFPDASNTPITFNNGISLNEALRLVYNSGVLQWQTRTGLGSYVGVDLAPASASTVTIAFASSANFLQARVVGQSQPTALTTEAYPSGLSKVNIGGIGINSINTSYQLTRRLALRFGPQNASTFADLFAKATILAAVS